LTCCPSVNSTSSNLPSTWGWTLTGEPSLHGADTGEVNGNVLLYRNRYGHRHGRSSGWPRRAGGFWILRFVPVERPAKSHARQGGCDNDATAAAPRCAAALSSHGCSSLYDASVTLYRPSASTEPSSGPLSPVSFFPEVFQAQGLGLSNAGMQYYNNHIAML
jgi:hypothetical protein